jgi:mannose/fructose/sorbose-specific phosphotransferase system IIA component
LIAVVIGTHGDFSEAILRSYEMISGKSENVACVTLEPGEGVDQLIEKYNRKVKELNIADGVLFVVDLFGGTPFNAVSKLALGNEKMEVISGINLAMLLEIMHLRYLPLDAFVEQAVESGKNGIQRFRKNTTLEEEELE